MSTLSRKENEQLETAVKNAEGVSIDKNVVLRIVVNELKKRDTENKFIVDTITTSCLKELYNKLKDL